MAFKFNVQPMATEPMDRIDLLQAQEELNHAFMDLTDAQKSMTEVCEVMENIQTSVDLIAKYGAAGVEQLNVDGSLEALCGVEAKLLTAEKAQEGLGEAAKAAWEKFKEWCQRAWQAIVSAAKRVYEWVLGKFSLASKVKEQAEKLTPEQAKAFGDTVVDAETAAESLLDTTRMPRSRSIKFSDAMDLVRCLNDVSSAMHSVDAETIRFMEEKSRDMVKAIEEDHPDDATVESVVSSQKALTEKHARVLTNKFVTFSVTDAGGLHGEWTFQRPDVPHTFAEGGWTVQNMCTFCKCVEDAKVFFKDRIQMYERAQQVNADVMKKTAEIATRQDATGHAARNCLKCMTQFYVSYYAVSVTLMQTMFKYLTGTLDLMSKTIYKVTLEANTQES